jgi:hypothetical protein
MALPALYDTGVTPRILCRSMGYTLFRGELAYAETGSSVAKVDGITMP